MRETRDNAWETGKMMKHTKSATPLCGPLRQITPLLDSRPPGLQPSLAVLNSKPTEVGTPGEAATGDIPPKKDLTEKPPHPTPSLLPAERLHHFHVTIEEMTHILFNILGHRDFRILTRIQVTHNLNYCRLFLGGQRLDLINDGFSIHPSIYSMRIKKKVTFIAVSGDFNRQIGIRDSFPQNSEFALTTQSRKIGLPKGADSISS